MLLRREPPGNDGKCLEMKVHEKAGASRTFAPATIVGPITVKQGFFNVPSGDVTGADGLYAFFWTNHCANPNPLQPSPDKPLLRPAANGKCPETDGRNSIGRSVMARSEDDGRTFSHVVAMPAGFVYVTAVNTGLLADLPEDQRGGIFILGVPRYRASVPYLAHTPTATIANPENWQFFSGRSPNGHAVWVSHDTWIRGTTGSADSGPQAWRPPGEANLLLLRRSTIAVLASFQSPGTARLACGCYSTSVATSSGRALRRHPGDRGRRRRQFSMPNVCAAAC